MNVPETTDQPYTILSAWRFVSFGRVTELRVKDMGSGRSAPRVGWGAIFPFGILGKNEKLKNGKNRSSVNTNI
jgi:hypothetical protein